jgi:hypothetical protein
MFFGLRIEVWMIGFESQNYLDQVYKNLRKI